MQKLQEVMQSPVRAMSMLTFEATASESLIGFPISRAVIYLIGML